MEAMMNFTALKKWMLNQITVNKRLKIVCLWYLLFLMVSVRKHSLTAAAQFSGLATSQFSRFLTRHPDIAVYHLHQLSKKQARQFSQAINTLANGKLPWRIAILIDSTIQHRLSLHAENVQRFNHGKGFQIGHQWTNIVLLINDTIIPLPPIPFYTKSYCRKHRLTYRTANELVVEYMDQLNLHDYIGNHNPRDVLVLADGGYDDHKIESAIIKKRWHFIIALNRTRSVKSVRYYLSTPKTRGWSHVAQLFKDHRRVRWQTIHVPVNRSKKKRMEFRVRQIMGYLRDVGCVQLICSEFKKRPADRKKYLACSDQKAKPRQILIGYRMRWAIEIFHKEIKMFLGFEDVATKRFSSVISHVHWVYCAYILLKTAPIRLWGEDNPLEERQHRIAQIIGSRESRRVIQLLTQINGPERYKTELITALESAYLY
jgi:hypothetical protein